MQRCGIFKVFFKEIFPFKTKVEAASLHICKDANWGGIKGRLLKQAAEKNIHMVETSRHKFSVGSWAAVDVQANPGEVRGGAGAHLVLFNLHLLHYFPGSLLAT